MKLDLRNKRLRAMVKKLNTERKLHAKRVDILCNDLISAQRDFIERLNTIDFSSTFYESIIGANNINELLYKAVEKIEHNIVGSGVFFFLRNGDRFDIYPNDNHDNDVQNSRDIEHCIDLGLAKNIYEANKVCSLDEIMAMDVDGCLDGLDKISALSFPIGSVVRSCGFIVMYRDADKGFEEKDIAKVSAVTSGLGKAIESFHQAAYK